MLAHPDFTAEYAPRAFQIAFFLTATSAVCVSLCHLNFRNRRSEFNLRRSLDEKNQQLQELDQLRTDFLANVSHELRTPLTLIFSPLNELLASPQPLPQAVGETLGLIHRNVDRLHSLVNDLLDMVRSDNARLRLELNVVDAREFLQGILRTVDPLAEARDIILEGKLATQPIDLYIDASRAERVFLNLLNNAIKFTPPEGRIRLSLRAEGKQAVIKVEDDGPGLPVEEWNRIFDRFYQSTTNTAPAQGLGLGLAIAREIMRQHGGELSLEQGELKGCCFVARLPLADAEQVKAAEKAPRIAATPRTIALPLTEAADDQPATSATAGQPVLVVDDEEDLRGYLVKSLTKDYAVTGAANGTLGIAAAEANPPRCILLDLMMPDMSGLDVLARLRKNPALNDTKIIVLTANTDERPKITALRNGADDFLSKPFSITEVRARVAGMVRTSLVQSELRREREELARSMRELKETQAQLLQSEKMRAIGSLAAGLLHEINNPVNYTLMAVRMLEKELAKKPEHHDTLKDVRDGIQRISDIVTDLRSYAYAENETAPAPFSLVEVVEGVRKFASHEIDDIAFRVDSSVAAANGNGSAFQVLGLRSQVMQVLLNLVLNAAHAIRKRSDLTEPAITLSARSESERAIITVVDNGCGIPADRLPRVCDPFYTSAEPGKGLGLGLSICDTIVRRHGGKLRITSEEGNGTAVEFDLPLAHSTGLSA
jgi:signal transduction histidine kinase